MANTYTQIHIQFVFAPKYRAALLDPEWDEKLHAYITGIVKNTENKMLRVNGVRDHLHMLVGFRTHQSIGDFMQVVKANSSRWINENKLTKRKFEWQSGYGAFSYSKSQVPMICNYIDNQKYHHGQISFIDEYVELLEEFDIDYDENYLLKEPE